MHDTGVPGGESHTDLSMECCLGFFAKPLTVWLTPAENISTLTLYLDDHGGYYAKVGIEKTSFPNLQALILGKPCFGHGSKRVTRLIRTVESFALIATRLCKDERIEAFEIVTLSYYIFMRT